VHGGTKVVVQSHEVDEPVRADMAAYNPLCTETLRVHMLYCNGSVSCGMTLCLKSVRLSAQGVVHREAGRPCMKV